MKSQNWELRSEEKWEVRILRFLHLEVKNLRFENRDLRSDKWEFWIDNWDSEFKFEN